MHTLVAAIALAAASLPAHAQPQVKPQAPHITVSPISAQLGLADIRITAPARTIESATLDLLPPDSGAPVVSIPMRKISGIPAASATADAADADLPSPTESFTARIQSPTAPDVRFSIRVRAPDGSLSTLGPRSASTAPPPDAAAPDWALGRVYYQIFPERFRNANPGNDPRTPDTTLLPWNSDWSRVTIEELEAARARAAARGRALNPGQSGGALFSLVTQRRYGGDLQGVVEQLDALKDLGIDAIYLCPIFQAQSMHKYDATDFRHIDQTLGNTGSWTDGLTPPYAPPPGDTEDPATWQWTEADRYFVDVLLPAAKSRGIRVVIDGVWNHTGREFFAFQDVLKNGRSSRYADWYQADFDPVTGKLIGYSGWDARNGTLPEFRQTPEGDLVEPVKQHIFNVTRRWMDPNGDGDPSDGVDGWRLDVAPDVGMKFWENWRAHVKSINPDAVLIGEVWFKATAYFNGKAFDGQMNYPFARPVVAWAGTMPDMTSDDLAAALGSVFDQQPWTNLVQMNLVGSHDAERIASAMYNPGRGFSENAKVQNGGPARTYRRGKPDDAAYRRSLLALALQATWEGSPMIYNGDEWGMHGADDPDNRKPVPWPDRGPYENPADAPDPEIRESYRQWLSLRRHPEAGPVLRWGDAAAIESGKPDIFVFDRTLNGRTVRTVLNRLPSPVDATLWVPAGAGWVPLVGVESGSAVGELSAASWISPR